MFSSIVDTCMVSLAVPAALAAYGIVDSLRFRRRLDVIPPGVSDAAVRLVPGPREGGEDRVSCTLEQPWFGFPSGLTVPLDCFDREGFGIAVRLEDVPPAPDGSVHARVVRFPPPRGWEGESIPVPCGGRHGVAVLLDEANLMRLKALAERRAARDDDDEDTRIAA